MKRWMIVLLIVLSFVLSACGKGKGEYWEFGTSHASLDHTVYLAKYFECTVELVGEKFVGTCINKESGDEFHTISTFYEHGSDYINNWR